MTTELMLSDQIDTPVTLERRTLEGRVASPYGGNPAAVYLASIGESSRRPMRGALDTVADWLAAGTDAFSFPWGQVRFQHTQAVRSKLEEAYAPSTANLHLSALRGVLKAAWRLGQMDAETYQKAIDVKAITGESLPAGRSIPRGELTALMDACVADQTASGVRDAAMLGLLYACGLRRGELVKLDLEDYDRDAGTLRVQGKRNKQRLAHVVEGAAAALADWLSIRGQEPGALFWAIRRGGHVQRDQGLTTQAVYKMLQKRARQAGVKEISPHDFRRTFVGDLLDAGADIATVQKMAGHANVQTTARYDRRPEEAKRKAAGLLHVPYRRRTLSNQDKE